MPRVIYWFRTDLRVHDSPALNLALELKPKAFFPIWTWDPHYVLHTSVGVNRFAFLLESQADLSSQLSRINKNQKLLVLRCDPIKVIPALIKTLKITHLVFEKDPDPYGSLRDSNLEKIVKSLGVECLSCSGRTLWDIDRLVATSDKPILNITSLIKCAKKLGPVLKPIPAPKTLADAEKIPLDVLLHKLGNEHQDYARISIEFDTNRDNRDLNKKWRTSDIESYNDISGPDGNFAVPTLKEIGYTETAGKKLVGGETVALDILENLMKDIKYMATFEKPKSSPAAFDPESTTTLSPYFHFGCLSPRLFYHKVMEAKEKYSGVSSRIPTSLDGQILFREMYFCAQKAVKNYSQTRGNKYCRYVPWSLANKYDQNGNKLENEYENDSEQARKWFQLWSEGLTGFPWIDALMRQLKQTGWIHHLGRHSVACFLTRGHCYISWERGAEVFEDLLLDHEPACNIGNWQWLSCTCFFSQFYRVYSPIAFGKKWDPEGNLIRKFCPELANFDKKYIYRPWEAPLSVQKKSHCIIGVDYPKPMLDEKLMREKNLVRMKQAYEKKIYGDCNELYGIKKIEKHSRKRKAL